MEENNNTETTSSIRISDDALAAIAALAATDIEGVASMAGNVTNEIVARLGVKNLSKGVKISYDGKEVRIELSLNVDYGTNIPAVCENVRNKVKDQVENMTGLPVSEVSIHIAAVSLETR